MEEAAFDEDTYRYRDFYGLKGDVALAGNMQVEFSAGTTADLEYSGSISGSGSLTVDTGVSGNRLILKGDNSDFSGTKHLLSGVLVAERDSEVQYGTAGTSVTPKPVEGAWKLGGGEGALVVNFLLSGENELLLGETADSRGRVVLTKGDNDFSGRIQYAGKGMVLQTASGALGDASLLLDYGHRLVAETGEVVNSFDADSAGMLLLDEYRDNEVDYSRLGQMHLAAGKEASYSGDIGLGQGDSYRVGALGGSTLTLQTNLSSAHGLVVDGAGEAGGVVVLAGNAVLGCDVVVQGNRLLSYVGAMTLALGQDMRFSGELTLKKGGVVDLSGHTLTPDNNVVFHGGRMVDSEGRVLRCWLRKAVILMAALRAGGTLRLESPAMGLLSATSGVLVNGGMLDISAQDFATQGVIALDGSLSVTSGSLNLGALTDTTSTYTIFDLSAEGATVGDWESMQVLIMVNGVHLIRYDGAVLNLTEDDATLNFSSLLASNFEGMLWNGDAKGVWNQESASWKMSADSADSNISYMNDDSVVSRDNASLSVEEGIQVKNLTIEKNTLLSLSGALEVTKVPAPRELWPLP